MRRHAGQKRVDAKSRSVANRKQNEARSPSFTMTCFRATRSHLLVASKSLACVPPSQRRLAISYYIYCYERPSHTPAFSQASHPLVAQFDVLSHPPTTPPVLLPCCNSGVHLHVVTDPAHCFILKAYFTSWINIVTPLRGGYPSYVTTSVAVVHDFRRTRDALNNEPYLSFTTCFFTPHAGI